MGVWGPQGSRVLAAEAYWKQPISWNRVAQCNCGAAGAGPAECAWCAGGCVRPRVLWDLSDPFEDWDVEMLWPDGSIVHKDGLGRLIPKHHNAIAWADSDWYTMSDARKDFFILVDATPQLDWLLLTKRPQNIRRMWPGSLGTPRAETIRADPDRHGVWLGCSVSDQATADAMIPELLKCRDLSPVLWISAEPSLGPIADGNGWKWSDLSWAVIGGESGSHARTFNLAWGSDMLAQLRDASVPAYMKQVGSNPFPAHNWQTGEPFRDRKGGNIDEFPKDFRVREFPVVGT